MPGSILALDVGAKRIGVARAPGDVRLAAPLTTIEHDDTVWRVLDTLIRSEQAATLVVGLPRGLDGQETEQTRQVREFIEVLKKHVSLPIVVRDEAVTSVHAEEELKRRGKPYGKGDIDALAATYILQDYLEEQA
ncbi:MAG TPA: Holliday junction resolvase RuvX [Chroococcales cyanobacterium]